MSLRNFMKIYTKAKKISLKKERTRALKSNEKIQSKTISYRSSQKNEIQDAIDQLKRGKAKTAMEYELNSLRTAVTKRRKIRTIFNEIVQRDEFTPKSCRKIRIQVINKKKVTEKMQVITDQYVACQYYTSGLPLYYTHDSLLVYTEYNLQTKRGFGPIIDVTRTLWCTECWSSVVVSGVYRCTSARSTSQKHLTASSIQRYGAPCTYGIKSAHVRLLQRLYSQQEGTVLTDKESDTLPIKRGTQQGDPLSS